MKIELSDLRFIRRIRDPIYGYIPITEIEGEIIDHEHFQRLDKILQMPTASLVYPSAKHTRKSHSLGTMHLAWRAFCFILYRQHRTIRATYDPLLFKEQIVAQTESSTHNLMQLDVVWPTTQEIRRVIQALRLAALIHDLGHAPFSHLFEDSVDGYNHEAVSIEIFDKIVTSQKKVGRFSSEVVNVCSVAMEILKGQGGTLPVTFSFLHEIISGPWDCDKLDYLVRDSYHAGTPEYGLMDVDRILSGLCVSERGQLRHHRASIESLLSAFKSYFYMYSAVYSHRTARIFDLMLGDAIKICHTRINERISNTSNVVGWNDITFLDELHQYCSMKRSSHKKRTCGLGQIKKAFRLVVAFGKRNKLLRMVAEERLDVDILWLAALAEDSKKQQNTQDAGDQLGHLVKVELLKLTETIERLAKGNGVTIVVDSRPRNRFLGAKIDRARSWIDSDIIYDPTADPPWRKLIDLNMPDFDSLRHISFPIRVFGEVKSIDGIGDTAAKKFEAEIKKTLQEGVKNIRLGFHGRHLAASHEAARH